MSRKSLLTTVTIGLFVLSSAAFAGEGARKGEAKSNQFWWPEQLNLQPLRAHDPESNPYHGENFNYAEAFSKLDLNAVKKDINDLLTTSQDWWPADYGNYGPFFIRMAWHSAGTYRQGDGRGGAAGGQMRFDPLNSWPDNANLDKARRLLWPIKQKYGKSLSWADLMVLTGNVAMENMGFKTLGFAGGREDDWEPDLVYWGSEKSFLADKRHSGKRKLEKPLGATQMGLIYVNPVGPNGVPDPLAAAHDIRVTFGRMGMNDEETVALIAGGHTFGKAHGAHSEKHVGAEPAAAPTEQQGFGWKNKVGKGNAEDTVTSGLEGAWTSAPARWTHMFLTNLFTFEWKQTKSPAGAIQWIPTEESAKNMVPDAHIPGKFHAPIMLTTDLSLKMDPEYRKISKRFLDNPQEFEKAFARAWFKLTHRDMGPRARYLGPEVPAEEMTWQDPVPARDFKVIDSKDINKLKGHIRKSGLTVPQLVRTAWASAASYRNSDMRGGANGARLRLAPQNEWAVNSPAEQKKVLAELEKIQKKFNQSLRGGKQVSLADVIVLGGVVGVETAAKSAGHTITVPFSPGRTDAGQDKTDVATFNELKPEADGFRNYFNPAANVRSPAEMLVDKANQLTLTVPEMTVLVGGMRALNANTDGAQHGVFTNRPGQLTNDFFVNLLDMGTQWKKAGTEGVYEGHDRATGKLRWTATPVDLIFGSNSELRAVAEVYAFDESKNKFVQDFVAAWAKVMDLDRFDLRYQF
ncbi:catalase/peroxidase HPI [Acanthopleuribacter pedis]|uniref:Catalase-peroxidase n=1 Tax=Acanthopleuribacter pedis TaxID=442870 RepID=A0A8J7U7M0_9BACT|nr:catalase/peroxidase HPI [Acanthopleuribacter pedis]MBO1323144.1 catalase/peroxidase HPI [Acanthopleuribacter pedis]